MYKETERNEISAIVQQVIVRNHWKAVLEAIHEKGKTATNDYEKNLEFKNIRQLQDIGVYLGIV